ncbi:hypothetical protein JAAARDRAFT_139229, partial [Jaapia argillacea MUCL 33604]
SFKSPKTAFTFGVLDHFHIDAVECKTAVLNFYSKLRRITDNAFPDRFPDRYQGLMRVSRQWQDLKSRKWFGFGHNPDVEPGKGGLALFCAACPQPGINLLEDWKEDPNQWMYRRIIVADGNFSLDHMKMKKNPGEVALTNGEGYTVESGAYETYLKAVKEVPLKSKCVNHRAISQANSNRHNLDATGVGACTCARHGCFVPHCVVDFQKGERCSILLESY